MAKGFVVRNIINMLDSRKPAQDVVTYYEKVIRENKERLAQAESAEEHDRAGWLKTVIREGEKKLADAKERAERETGA